MNERICFKDIAEDINLFAYIIICQFQMIVTWLGLKCARDLFIDIYLCVHACERVCMHWFDTFANKAADCGFRLHFFFSALEKEKVKKL